MKNIRPILSLAIAAPLMMLAGTASAQSAAPALGACGQPAVLNSQPMTLESTPTELTGSLVELRRNEPRYIELTVNSPMAITLSTLTSERDTTLILFDATGAVVGSDDDSGEESNARLIMKLDPGTYCAQVNTYGGLDASSLVVPLSISAAPPPDACILNAGQVVDLKHDSEEIITTGVLGENVNLAFNLAEATRVTIAARSPMFDTMLTVQDEFGREIATDDDGGGDTNSLLEMEGGNEMASYCVTLSSLDDERGIYSLSLSPALANPMTPEAQQEYEAAQEAESAADTAQEAADAAASAVSEAALAAERAAAEAAAAAAAAAEQAAGAVEEAAPAQ